MSCNCPMPDVLKTGLTGHQENCPVEQRVRQSNAQKISDRLQEEVRTHAKAYGDEYVSALATVPVSLRRGRCPYRCPVCGGRTTVQAGFYTGGLATGTAPETCRSCGGTGVVWG